MNADSGGENSYRRASRRVASRGGDGGEGPQPTRSRVVFAIRGTPRNYSRTVSYAGMVTKVT